MSPAKTDRYLACAAVLYLLFVVYGSLVPLEFKAMPFDQAWHRFRHIPYLDLGIGSLADWVANILLMIPLAFLWFTLLTKNSGFPAKAVVFLAVLFFCCLLALGIEFTQIFFPQRTVSINDLIAEAWGSAIGAAAGWIYGDQLRDWLQDWQEALTVNAAHRYLQIYLFGLFLYAVLPLDLTLSPVEFYHKWNEGRVILIPFSRSKDGVLENLYEWFSDIALWIPVPLLWLRSNPQAGSGTLYRNVFLAASIVEFFQLFVYSRMSDLTDIVLATIGGGIGIEAAKRFRYVGAGRYRQDRRQWRRQSRPLAAAFVVGWSVLLLALYWYPYDFNFDGVLLKDKKAAFFKVPFAAYYFGTEFRAITEFFHKVLFFMPLGAAFAVISGNFQARAFNKGACWLWLAATALAVEAGQLLLPDKNADLTDWFLEMGGGLIGYYGLMPILAQSAAPPANAVKVGVKPAVGAAAGRAGFGRIQPKHGRPQTPLSFFSPINGKKIDFRLASELAAGVVLFAFGLLALSRLDFVPYNVRELLAGPGGWLRGFGLAASLFWGLGYPVFYLHKVFLQKRLTLFFGFKGVTLHSGVMALLLLASAPLESIHDVVGAPVWDSVPGWTELWLRLTALFGGYALLLFAAVLNVFSLSGIVSNLHKFYVVAAMSFIIMMPLCFWLVVLAPAADNIVELLPDEGRSWRVSALALYFWLSSFIGAAAAGLAAFRQFAKLFAVLALLMVSYPLGYALWQWGTEQLILKYGVLFSALQFLFSADRDHYASAETIKMRFYAAHSLFLAAVLIAQFPQWLRLRRLSAAAAGSRTDEK